MILSAAVFFGAALVAEASPVLVPVKLKEVYIPTGFDDNDIAQVIVEVEFPSTGYRLGPIRQSFQKNETGGTTIGLSAMAYQWEDPGLSVVNHAIVTVDLKPLPPGKYEIADHRTKKKFGDLVVRQAKNPARRDEFLYAPVTAASLNYDLIGRRQIMLRMIYPNTCLELKRVSMRETSKNLIEILPILEVVDAPDCVSKAVPMSIPVLIPDEITSGRKLLHIRTFDGGSLNHPEFIPPLEEIDVIK